MDAATDRTLLRAEILSIGSELTVGDTRDTNSAELARSLTSAGVAVSRITALPDRLDMVAEAFEAALARVDLVVSTGGLGPTPDDLTREAIARVVGETPSVDASLETWLRQLWSRRGIEFPPSNIKQAWLIPSAVALPNPNGTAPGWLVTRPDGRVLVALPGPPREMRPMWDDHVLPALSARGLGADVASRTYRLMGVGESHVAELLGEEMLRRSNPEVATYARADAVDVRVSAVAGPAPDGSAASAAALVEAAAALVEQRLGDHIWAMGDETWSAAIGRHLVAHGWRLAIAEIGTGGRFGDLLGDVEWLALRESLSADSAPARAVGTKSTDLVAHARRAAAAGGCQAGVAVRARERKGDTAVSVAIVTPSSEHHERHMAFLGGHNGRARSALIAAGALLTVLRDLPVGAVAPSAGTSRRAPRGR